MLRSLVTSLHLSMDVRRNVFLIVKEAVNNLAKYSDCTTVRIDFFCAHGCFEVVVGDDGKGFEKSYLYMIDKMFYNRYY